MLWLPVITGVKEPELLIFPEAFSKQQQPQQFSFGIGLLLKLFGREVLCTRVRVLLGQSGVESVV